MFLWESKELDLLSLPCFLYHSNSALFMQSLPGVGPAHSILGYYRAHRSLDGLLSQFSLPLNLLLHTSAARIRPSAMRTNNGHRPHLAGGVVNANVLPENSLFQFSDITNNLPHTNTKAANCILFSFPCPLPKKT